MIVKCPVCLRQVSVTDRGMVRRHNDTANRLCQMFGRLYPLEQAKRRTA